MSDLDSSAEELVSVLKGNIQNFLALSVAQDITKVSISTLRRSHKAQADHILEHATVSLELTRTRVPVVEVLWISNWLLEHAPVRSGTESERVAEWGSWSALYSAYLETVVPTEYPFRSLSFVQGLALQLKIKRAKFDRYL